MNTIRISGSLAFLAIASLLSAFESSTSPADSKPSTEASAPIASQADEIGSAPGSVPAQQRVMAAEDILSSDPAFVALSVEEAEWLEANGFPTQAEINALASYDPAELLARSRELRDQKATTLLGLRRMMDGDYRRAVGSLAYASNLGSLYAREQMAFAELKSIHGYEAGQESRIPADAKATFVARMEVARILGDHRVDQYIDKVAGDLDRSKYGDYILKEGLNK